jgi:hypothetical protein
VLPLPSPDARHVLSRFTYGVSEEVVADLYSFGDGAAATTAWFEKQLQPESIPDDYAASIRSWWPHLWWSPKKQWEEDQRGGMQGWQFQDDFIRWTIVNRMYSKRQLLEVMTEFWSNLLHVPAPLGKTFPQRVAYDGTIRVHALGRFEDLLVAAVLHPAMLCYLDNATSTCDAPNENLGREVLELHSVGHEAGITQDDVIGSTRILTGWRVDTRTTWEGYYSTEDHYVGPVKVFDFTDPNDSPDGRALTKRYLRWLARHPQTSRRIAERLAIRFVSDTPSDTLIADLAKVFRSSGTDIKATLRALIAHPEFKAAKQSKARTPSDDLINSYRVLQIGMDPPKRATDAAARILISAKVMGQKPFDWPAPNGFPETSEAWSSASRVLGSWLVHRQLSLASVPASGVHFRPIEEWFPQLPCRFDAFVSHVAGAVLAMPAPKRLIKAAAQACGVATDEIVRPDSVVAQGRFRLLMLALLDTPEHMSR